MNIRVRMKKVKIFLLIPIIFFFGCVDDSLVLFKQNQNNNFNLKQELSQIGYKFSKKHTSYQYKIKPQDRLNITIFNHPELSSVINNTTNGTNLQGTLVYPDGTINLPLIGKVKIAGLTEEQASEKLTKLYAQYIKKPFVQVDDVSKKIYVLGEVNHPRVIYMSQDTISLIEAISDSGGFTDKAKRSEIKIISGNWNHPTMTIVDLTKLSPKDLNKLVLKPNEIVYVTPIKSKPLDIRILGIQPVIDFVNSILSGMVNVKTLRE